MGTLDRADGLPRRQVRSYNDIHLLPLELVDRRGERRVPWHREPTLPRINFAEHVGHSASLALGLGFNEADENRAAAATNAFFWPALG